jgi:rhodanese-related sulfurtransferase
VKSYIVVEAARLRVPASVMLRTGLNVALELIIGAVPVARDLFDFAFKANSLAELPHATAARLSRAMATEQPPLLLDLRGASMIAQTGPMAGAVVTEHDLLEQALCDWPRHRAMVTLCACPQGAGAIEAAQRLLAQGYLDVRPLKGGYDAWIGETA